LAIDSGIHEFLQEAANAGATYSGQQAWLLHCHTGGRLRWRWHRLFLRIPISRL